MLKNTSQLKMISLLLLGALSSFALNAHGDEAHPNKSTLFVGIDSEPAHTVTAFKKALKQGDQVTARKLLADNVIIFEGGGIERSADEYANHHMHADMAFLKAVESTLLEHQVFTQGDIAFSIARSSTEGSYKGKEIKSIGMETITLKNTDNGWKITHIHWSN